jgi:serine/threonine-protein kinase
MEIICTRPGCPRPNNYFTDLDQSFNLQTAQQKYCTTCGMPLILAGRYLPSKLLGQGGFGAAYLACDRYTPTLRNCVVKQFQPAGNLSSDQLEIALNLFEREALVLERLGSKHPQIPDLYAYFPLVVNKINSNQQEQFFYLVQEFIDGEDLEHELAKKGKFTEQEVLEILQSLLPVLKFVHENNSIHRDIKPSNIMRSREGVLYLLDFGAVKEVANNPSNNPLTPSTGIYSQGFAPPEQMAGNQVYPCTDLYALAATCVILLTGKSSQELYDSYNNRWHWQQFAPQLGDRLTNILNQLLQSSPANRFQSAQEVINCLVSPPPTPKPTIIQPPQQAVAQKAPSPQTSSTPPIQPKKPSISAMEFLGNAAFTGFETSLLSIIFTSLIPNLEFALVLGGVSFLLILIALYFRIIEKFDLIIIAIITVAVIWFVPSLHLILSEYNLAKIFLIIIPFGVLIVCVFIAAIFRLIYQLLSGIL